MALGSKYTKGIEIEIGGNTTGLKVALDSANKSIKTTQGELDTLKNSLKLEWNADNFKRAQELAQRAVEQTRQKADTLRKALAELNKQGDKKDSEQYEALRRELSYVEVAAQKAEIQMEKLNHTAEQAKVNNLTEQLGGVDAALDTTGVKLDVVRAKLEKNWDAKTFDHAQGLAQDAISKTEQKAELLREKMALLEQMGVDKTSAEYQKLEHALAQTEGAAERARQQLEDIDKIRLDQINKAITDAGNRLDSAGNKLTVGLTVPLAAAGTAAFNFASDLDESMNKVDVAFGGAATQVEEWSQSTLTSIGLAKGTALDMAALYGDMATSMKIGEQTAADMSTTLVNLAGDLASFKNIGIDQANTALKSIFTGETESLKGLGVVMTQTNLEAYAMAQGFKTAYKDMDQAQQVMVRYQYVLDATKNAQGDFARTGDGAANQVRILKESLKEAAATAGNDLLPAITPIIANLAGMVQSFGDLDEGTRKAIVNTALFVAGLGPMLKLTGGVVKAIEAGRVAYAALTVAKAADTVATGTQAAATTAATTAQTGLNVAMAANPIGAVITAVGALVAVLGSFTVTAALTADKTDNAAESNRKAREEYAKTTQELQSQKDSTLTMVSTLDNLVAAEDKTAAQKASILSLVEQLNEAVPNLNLAYDAQTDSLNQTTGSIREMALAMAEQEQRATAVERLSDAYVEQQKTADELTKAQKDLTEAQGEFDAQLEKATSTGNYDAVSSQTAANLETAKRRVKELTDEQTANNEEIKSLESSYRTFNDTAKETAEATDTTAQRLSEMSKIMDETKGACELLSKGQKEMSDTGYLSLDTVIKMLDTYPELEGYLVETADGYQLADGALKAYTATQRASYELAYNNAAAAAQEIIDAELVKKNAIIDTTESMRDQLEATAAFYRTQAGTEFVFGKDYKNNDDFYAQGWVVNDRADQAQAALSNLQKTEEALKTFDRIMASTERDSSSKKSSSKKSKSKEKTAAELELEAYQEAVKALDHLRAMDMVSEEEYYRRKAVLGNRYLTNNKEARQKLDEELHAWQKGAYERDLEELRGALEHEEITKAEFFERWKGLQSQYLQEGSDERKAAEAAYQKELKQANQDAYDEQMDDLKYFLDLDLINQDEYYQKSAQLRDQYLEKDSDAWRKATVEIYQYQKEQREKMLEELKDALDSSLKAVEESYKSETDALKEELSTQKDLLREKYNADKDAAKEAYDRKKSLIEKELALEKDRLNAVLDGIDAEIQARKELREDENQDDAIAIAQKRLDAAKAQLEFARTDEDRKAWENEIILAQKALDKAIQDKEDTAFYREKEQEKEQVKEQISAAEDAAKKAKEQAKVEYDAALSRLEDAYNASLKQAEEDYKRRLQAAEDAYNDRVSALQDRYEREQEAGKRQPSSGNSGSSGTSLGDKISNVVSGVANAVGAMAGVVNRTINNKTNTANLTINQGGGMTEGQVARAVRKVLNELDR